MGYYNGELTSYYDEELENAVKAFQTANNFEESNINGKLDNLTIRYLLAKRYKDQIGDYLNEVNQVING